MINIQEIPEFKECTAKEQDFLRVYLNPETDDYLNIETATITAFSISETNALAYGRQVLSRPRIKKIVELTNTEPLPSLEQFKRKLWTTINQPQKDSRVTLGALSLYADISGWKAKASAKKDASDSEGSDALNDITFEQHTAAIGTQE